MQRLAILMALALAAAACGNGTEPYYPYETLPQPGARTVHTTVTTGSPGDHWIDTMPYVRVERASRDGEHGYAITYDAPKGGTLTLFWGREQIDFTSRPAGSGQRALDLESGRLIYPELITARSLPDVHRAIMILETSYAKEADGAIAAMQGFVTVVAMGPGPRVAVRAPPRGPPPRPAIPAARVAASKFKLFTERNFRENLTRLTGGQPKGAHAHHVLPIKHGDKFDAMGINIHDPQYGAWWSANQHLSAAKAYNRAWDEFLTLPKKPSREQILQFARQIAADHGLQIYF